MNYQSTAGWIYLLTADSFGNILPSMAGEILPPRSEHGRTSEAPSQSLAINAFNEVYGRLARHYEPLVSAYDKGLRDFASPTNLNGILLVRHGRNMVMGDRDMSLATGLPNYTFPLSIPLHTADSEHATGEYTMREHIALNPLFIFLNRENDLCSDRCKEYSGGLFPVLLGYAQKERDLARNQTVILFEVARPYVDPEINPQFKDPQIWDARIALEARIRSMDPLRDAGSEKENWRAAEKDLLSRIVFVK